MQKNAYISWSILNGPEPTNKLFKILNFPMKGISRSVTINYKMQYETYHEMKLDLTPTDNTYAMEWCFFKRLAK